MKYIYTVILLFLGINVYAQKNIIIDPIIITSHKISGSLENVQLPDSLGGGFMSGYIAVRVELDSSSNILSIDVKRIKLKHCLRMEEINFTTGTTPCNRQNILYMNFVNLYIVENILFLPVRVHRKDNNALNFIIKFESDKCN